MKRYIAPPLKAPQIYRGYIPHGYRGTQSTLDQIKALIRVGAKDFYVRQKAIDILLKLRIQPKDYLGEIKALFEWVQRNVRYTKDPFRVEVLHSARRMLELRAGDCDDMTILLGAMLEAIGHPVRLVVVGSDPLRPQLFSHIYLEVDHKGRWIPLDPTMPYAPGWAPHAVVKQIVAIERRLNMLAEDMDLQGSAAVAAPASLPSFIRALHREAIQPKDARVKSLWDLLRQRGLLSRSQWMQRVLRFVWERGLQARPRPRTTRRLVRLLRRWAILPPARWALRRAARIRPARLVASRRMRRGELRSLRPAPPAARRR